VFIHLIIPRAFVSIEITIRL